MGEDVAVARKSENEVAAPPVAKPQDTVKDPLVDPLAQQPQQAQPKAKAEPAQPEAAPAQAEKAKDDKGEKPAAPRPKEGTAQGRAQYQALLGEALGGKLYEAVAPHLTLEALSKYATQGLDGALKGLAGQLGNVKGEVDPAAVKAFSEVLGKTYGPMAGDWMKSEGGQKLAKSTADWVDANPEWIVALALTAVAGAIIADMPLPEVKQKIGLGGGFEAEVAAKLGTIRNMAVEELRATVRYQSEAIKASVGVKTTEKGENAVEASATFGGKEANLTTNATVTENGLEVAGLKGFKTTALGDVHGGIEKAKDKEPEVKIGITRKDGDTSLTDSARYDTATGKLTFGKELLYEKDGNKAKATQTTSSDGSRSAGLELGKNLGGGLSASFGGSQTIDAAGKESNALKAGLNYNSNKVKANLGVETNLGDTTSYKIGGAASYEDGLNKARLGYQYDSGKQQHDLNAMGQVGVTDDVAVRGSVQHTAGPEGSETKVGAHAAKFTTKDLAIFGGGTYELNSKGRATFVPEVGVQVKGVSVKFGYDPSQNAGRIGLQIPF